MEFVYMESKKLISMKKGCPLKKGTQEFNLMNLCEKHWHAFAINYTVTFDNLSNWSDPFVFL